MFGRLADSALYDMQYKVLQRNSLTVKFITLTTKFRGSKTETGLAGCYFEAFQHRYIM